MKSFLTCFLFCLLLLTGCVPTETASKSSVKKAFFGTTQSGENIDLFTVTNSQGMEMKVTNYGGIIVSLLTPDKDGSFQDIVLGYDSLKEYEEFNPYFGAIIGRYGNRIANAKFSLEDVEYTLAANNDPNHLHGGWAGFDKVIWQAQKISSEKGVGVQLKYTSVHMEEGYPGNLLVSVTYLLAEDNSLSIGYEAQTDRATVVNLTQHTYFNLSGDARRDILDHQLEIAAGFFTPVDSTLIPTGEYRSVDGTPFDFRKAKTIGGDIDKEDEQLRYGNGYDHNWVLDNQSGEMAYAGSLFDPVSGRRMEIHTTEPGLQFYAGNFLDGTVSGKKGVVYKKRYGLCLETQHYPDSPNQPDFPSVVLNPGETYKTRTIYKFSTKY